MATTTELATQRYDVVRSWVRDRRGKGKSWDYINSPRDESEMKAFLTNHENDEDWPAMSVEDYRTIVSWMKQAEERNLILDKSKGQAMVIDGKSDNGFPLPMDSHSSWQLYKAKLLNIGFNEEKVGEMERSCYKILQRLNPDTRGVPPVKGLVIGNVQSGKTANMAGLMAMAADCGWNMFVILSGTIDNLREQTRKRLFNDLRIPGNLNWIKLDQLSKKQTGASACDPNYWPKNLDFSPDSRDRHFVVCLKNSTRLKDLIKWMQWDPNTQNQMRVLVIDDEADQASVNTANISKAERKAINRAICAMVNGYNETNKVKKGQFLAMNYIGYTATPYANILNETSEESLYPKNFISTLSVSKEYFGPQQIFGGESTRYEGLDIVRIVDKSEVGEIKDIHGGGMVMPDSLINAISWFICCVAVQRLRGYRRPVSMLIHTSQKTEHHGNVYDAVKHWLDITPKSGIMQCCEDVWIDETNRLSLDVFKEQYDDYGLTSDGQRLEVEDYPTFDEIKGEIEKIISHKATPILRDNTGENMYHCGIHMCEDNSINNPKANDDLTRRLSYPSSSNMPSFAPAFIVIGGATLSRGLTIEGLTSTFFLRTVKQADTLMQMGRWFGYRRGYELLPRIWMTEDTKNTFKSLSDLDQDLRDEIQWMETTGNQPDVYSAKLDYLGIIKLTAKNKSQLMEIAEKDFSGAFTQTHLFDEDKDVLEKNLKCTSDFIESLGGPEVKKACNAHAKHNAIWRSVKSDKIKGYLEQFKFNDKMTVFKNIKELISWIDEINKAGELNDWNVIVASNDDADNGTWSAGECTVNKIVRTRKITKNEVDGVINIGVLRNPSDIISDIDLDGQNAAYLQRFNLEKKEEKLYKALRAASGLEKTPQLIIYVVDKDSKASANSKTRKDLKADCDVVGICLNVPGAQKNSNYVTKVRATLTVTSEVEEE